MPFRTKAFYGLGESVSGVTQTATDTFLLFYLTAVVGLSGTRAGAALFIALLVDSIADPLIGYLSDNTRSRWGRRHPYLFISVVPLAIAIGLVYSTPRLSNEWLLFAWVTSVLLMLRIFFSVYALPFIALGAELSSDYRERSVIQAYRSFFWIAAYAITIYVGLGLFLDGDDGLLNRPGYVGFGWTCTVLVVLVGLLSTFGTFKARPALPRVVARRGAGVTQLLAEVGDVARNPSFLVLFLTVLTFWVAQGVANSLWLHASKYFWDLPPSVIRIIPITGSIGFAVGIPISAVLLRRYEKLTVAVVSLAVISLIQVLPALARILHWMPDSGTPLYVILGALQLLLGITSTALGIAFPSMMADAADEHELLFGSRREGLYFAGLTLSAKSASGVGAFAAGVGLDLIGFPSNLADSGALHLADDVVRNLGIIWGPGAGLISLLSVVTMLRYRLNRGEHARIRQELRRRAAET